MLAASPVQSPQHNVSQILSQDTISARIDSLTKFFSQAALRHQHSAYPSILANVFGYDQTKGWGLTKLTPTSDPVTFRVVSSFLEPTGPLFTLTGKLEQANLFYEFPLSCLPPPSQASIISPVKLIPEFYQDKVPSSPPHTLPSRLQLRAFDFFFFHFAYFLIYSQHIKHINPSSLTRVWDSISTCLYTSLLDAYLNHFLPIQATANRTPSPAHGKFSPNRLSSLRASPTREDTRRRHGSQLLRPDFLSDSPVRRGDNTPLLGLQTVREGYGHSVRFLETLVEFWLRQVEPSNPVDNYLGRGAQQQTHFMTEAHARFVRVLCKHLHFWTAKNPPHSDPASLSHAVLRQPLFQFLRYCLAHWPQEPSYRMLLELWLTQIQPWRYEDVDKQAKSGHATRQQLEAKWSEFVSMNLPFYSTLFIEFLPRAFRLNLSSTRDVVVLNRVMRVFSQPGLPDMIRQGEGVLGQTGGLYPKSRLLPDKQELQMNVVELMGSVNAFTPMMTSQTLQGIGDIRKSIDTTLSGLTGEGTEHEGRGMLARLVDWVSKFAEPDDDDPDGAADGDPPKKEKIQHSLQQCLHYFDCLFQNTDGNDGSSLKNELNDTLGDSFLSPDRTDSFSRISKARMEGDIMNNLDNVYKLEYMGDPVLRAIQPHENKFLCKHFHRLSLFLNRKLTPQLTYLSENPDLFVSRAASLILNERPPPSPLEDPLQPGCELPRLRFNLRPLASYHVLSMLFLCYTLPTIVGITPVQLISILSVLFAIVFLVQYLSSAKK